MQSFKRRLESNFRGTSEIKVWDWDEYYGSVICDGTQWSLEIRWDGKEIETEGSNAYPDSEKLGVATDPFKKLLDTLKEVTGKEIR